MPGPIQKNRLWLSQGISAPTFDATGEHLFSVRSADGRTSIVRQNLNTGLTEIVTAEPAPRGTVGYGGGDYAVLGELLVYAAEGGLIAVDLQTGEQRKITPSYEGAAAPAIAPGGRFVAFVIEQDGHADVLVVDAEGTHLPVKLSDSPDFAANPTFSSDGTRVAWMEWKVGRMPWAECALRVARLNRQVDEADFPAALLPPTVGTLAGENVSYANPQFSPDGSRLAYTSDESGWRSLYIADADGQGGGRIDTGTGEIGGPDWMQGQFAVRWGGNGERLYAVRHHRATQSLVCVSLPGREVETLDSPWTEFDGLVVCVGKPDLLAYTATSPKRPLALVTRWEAEETVRASGGVGLNDPAGLAEQEVIEWPTVDGTLVYGVLTKALVGEGPRPVLVTIHGGPTSEDTNGWNPEAQYWAGKGWHVLSVNHRGGTGSGRAYQDMLNGQWGVVDVEDARSGAEYLIGQGLADPKRVVITGGSAGGYTTLMALVRDADFWAAGVSLYGIGNMYDLRLGSHRFEATYEDTIVGPLPEEAERWIERSPLTHVENVRAPVLLFHGKEDKAVPHEQSIEFAEAVRRQGGIAELVLYDDEGHGFRKQANRKDRLEQTERFLEKYVLNLQGRGAR
ncbi:MAG: S9 family peptidase [Chloroflexota bacterium]|nr:S9 family peptidase [Chloroflexota bacterium]